MKEIKLNMISRILIGFAIIVITSLVVIEVVKYCGANPESNALENMISVFEGERHIDFLVKEPTVKVNDKISLKPGELIIENNSAELFITMDLKDFNEIIPLKCKIYDSKNNLVYETEDVGNIYAENKDTECYGLTSVCLFKIENYVKDNSNLKFELYDKNNKLLSDFDLDTTYKEFKSAYDEKFETISEEKLRNFLSTVSTLEFNEEEIYNRWIDIALNFDYNYDNFKYNSIEVAEFPWKENEEYSTQGYLVEDVDKIIEDFYGMPVEDKMNDMYEILEKDGKRYYVLIDSGCGYSGVRVVDITSIEYSNGIYNVTYTYWFQGEQTELEFESEYGKQPIYERNIELVKNEEGALTEFKILSTGDKKEI